MFHSTRLVHLFNRNRGDKTPTKNRGDKTKTNFRENTYALIQGSPLVTKIEF